MKRIPLHIQILTAMAIGAAIGLPLNTLAGRGVIDPEIPRTVAFYGAKVGSLFLRLLMMVVVPLIATSLISGVTGTGGVRGLGKLGGRTFAYYMLSSMLAITTGLILVNIVRPGVGAHLPQPLEPRLTLEDRIAALETIVGEQHNLSWATEDEDSPTGLGSILWEQLLRMIPTNPIKALAEGDILPIIFFSLILGAFITVVGQSAGALLTSFFNSSFEVMMSVTMFIIRLAPIGVLGFMLDASAGQGLETFYALGWYMLTVFLALAFHACITLPVLVFVLGRRSPWTFAHAMSPALATAFSTASSNATLPLTLTCVEQRAGISNRISSFVLPLGATINMDGTALYEAVAVLFIAQATPGYDLNLAQQIIVALTALLASVGAAGIPHAGTVMMVIVLQAVGLPIEAVGSILAVDRILDMCRTTVNVWSDSTATAVVARFEGNATATPVAEM